MIFDDHSYCSDTTPIGQKPVCDKHSADCWCHPEDGCDEEHDALTDGTAP